jgi:RNA-directed DNA polymerase
MSDIAKTQRSFARKASVDPEHKFRDLYHLICREEWIREALGHVLANKGARTPGVDGISKKDLETEEQQAELVKAVQHDLKAGTYKPMPVRRKWIPKPGKDEMRGLGIPTIRDRVIQEALRMLMEPIWESDFLDCSNGFRPGRRTMDCIHTVYSRVTTQNKYYWVIEGDIRKCFDRINHHILLRLIQQRIADCRIVALVEAFLNAGILDDGLVEDTPEGTPQGGILSPLLANIYLHQLDLWWWRKFGNLSAKQKFIRRSKGLGNAVLSRYADDFIVLWNGTHQAALELREELRAFLWDELHLELSEEKTRVTHATEGFDFLGFNIRYMTPGKGGSGKPWLWVRPSKKSIAKFKLKIKALTKRNTTLQAPDTRFKSLNRVIRGWGNYYQHVSASEDKVMLDWWINQRVLIWLKNKHKGKGVRWILRKYKLRETTGGRYRWNFGSPSTNGHLVWIAKLTDIPKLKYYRRKLGNPYLSEEFTLGIPEAETPFLEPYVVNIPTKMLEWEEARRLVLERDGYQCVQCSSTEDLHVHHRVAQHQGGTIDPENLETLCGTCHRKTATYGVRAL